MEVVKVHARTAAIKKENFVEDSDSQLIDSLALVENKSLHHLKF